jgi:hypothetical protein
MSTILSLSLLTRVDRNAIGTGAGLVVAVANEYNGALKPSAEIDVSLMDADTLEALKKVMDHFTFDFEAGTTIVCIDYDAVAQSFDLTGSYARSGVSTAAPSALPDGTEITMRVEFAGFNVHAVLDVTALYNQAFSAPDLAALAAAGVTVTGTGAAFTLTSARECKVYFMKPAAVAGTYVIDYPAQESVIPAN